MKLLTLILLLSSVYANVALADVKTSGLLTCVVCHGSGLQGNKHIAAPNLSILPLWYISAQLESYAHNWRSADPSMVDAKDMRAVAIALSDKERAEALQYISGLPPHLAKATINGDASHGKQLFSGCSACHGSDARGNETLKAPPLAGQNDWYIVSQLKAFKANHRGYAKEDVSGNVMHASASMLSTEQDMLDVASYINTIN